MIAEAVDNIIELVSYAPSKVLYEWHLGCHRHAYPFNETPCVSLIIALPEDGTETISTNPRERTDGDTTTWQYHDPTGLELCKTYADGSQVHKTYDAFNRLATETDARGVVKTHIYDQERGLLLSTSYSDATTPREFAYNHLGQLTQVTDDAGTRTLSYNAYGEAEVDSLLADGVTHTITEQRDDLGRSTGYTYAKDGAVQQTVRIGYATDGRISTAGFLHGGALKRFEYSYLPGSNLLEKLTMPNNMTLTQSYEPQRNLLTGMEYKRGDALVTQRSYTYDALARPLTRDTQYPGKAITHNDSFAHNTRSELVHAQLDDTMYGYDYDNIGNRRMSIEGNESSIYEANELNQYTSIADGANNFEPQFDPAGNQTLVKTNTGIWHITYNAENRPERFTSDEGSTIVECAYDHMGRRSYKKVTTNGEVTLYQRYIYRGYLQIAACDLTRTASPALWHILWDPTQPTATRPLAIRKDGVWYAYGWDLTKNICEIYGQTGYIRTLYTYSPYGAVSAEGDVTQPIQWSSELFDDELGLVYYNHRYYNLNEGKWISKDFIKDRQFNLYSYVGNNPIGASDLLGLATIVLVYDGGDSMFNNWAQYIKAAIEKGESTAYGNNISYDVDNDHIIMLESSDDMFDKLKEIKDITYLGTFGHGQRGMIYWSTNDGQVVMGIPGYKVVYEDGSQQLSLSELASLNFINFVTIEIYHCYAGRFYACSQDGRLLIDEEGECREAERGDIK